MEVISAALRSACIDHACDSDHDQQTLKQVRKLLLSVEQKSIDEALRRLDSIEQRLDDPATRSKDISEVIVPVLREQLTVERELRQILQPVLVEQFHKTARDEPDVMAEALFPILGPAVRKMIANWLSLDKNAKKRAYKLEQLLLIDKESGLPIAQVTSDTVFSQDADMVSGMLSAIQSFVHDAFSADEFDGLNTLQVGELSVLIEWGPSTVLAAVVRGAHPKTLRDAMQVYLENIHIDHEKSLNNYTGNRKQFEYLEPDLIEMLDSHDGGLRNQLNNLSTHSKRLILSIFTALLCLAGLLVYSVADARKWERYVSKLGSVPGVVVLNHERAFNDYKITALKDPDAIIPDTLLKDSEINPKYISHRFEAYQALHPKLLLDRVKAILHLPPGVSLSINGSVLSVSGEIDYYWLQEARNKLSTVAGIKRIVVSDTK